ncbi:flagellar protein FliT [Salibacterium aidingense]|uniref:flagellar protein FliT n=1 Tax=Salibacterium aidingense TaxID=384933 RepID=UPI000424461C|nr:flagellar protein FliT [Salibacterium aidingense]
MALVKELYLVTKALYEHMSQPLPKELEARDRYVEELEQHLEKRASLLQRLKDETEFSEAEKSLGAEMFKMNEEIQRFMEASRGELRLGMQELKKKKQSSQRYERPYTGPTVDGVFFDKKN